MAFSRIIHNNLISFSRIIDMFTKYSHYVHFRNLLHDVYVVFKNYSYCIYFVVKNYFLLLEKKLLKE